MKHVINRSMLSHSFKISCFLLALALFGLPANASAQEKQKSNKITVLPVPAIGYSPETKTYLGAVMLVTLKNLSDTLTRTSNAKVEFNYTWNKQIIAESEWNWFSPGEKWFSKGLIHYSKYPDLYYGIGFDSPDFGETSYQSNRVILNVDALRNIKNKLYLGLGTIFKSYQNIEYLSSGQVYPELADEISYGINLIALNDSRNNILNPSAGSFFQISSSFNFSTDFYFITKLDFRKYFTFGEAAKHVSAGRIYHSNVIGNPPFFDYPMMGGDEYTRGYYLGRFIDRNLSFIQLEHRIKLFWRFGLAAFGGVAALHNNTQQLNKENFKPNAGIGIRFLIDKHENTSLRMDYAMGSDNQSGFYISFGESF